MPQPAPDTGTPAHRLPKSQRVLLLVDFINALDFPGAEKLAGPALAAAQATAALRKRLRADGVPAIFANDNFGVWQSDFRGLVANCLGRPGAAGEIARTLHPQADDLTVLKPRHSAFYASPLDLLLTGMGARELVVCGLATDMCVQLTAADAFLREYRIWVPSDCTAAETPDARDTALRYMRDVLKCDIRPSTEAAGAFGR